jgi:hypothetical protein
MVSGRVLVDVPPFPLDRVCELLAGTGEAEQEVYRRSALAVRAVLERRAPEGAVVGP